MALKREFRIVVPVTCDEYRIGQLFSVAKMSQAETKGDSGVEVLVNEPYEGEYGKGQFTHKIYHLGSRIPGWLGALAPADALKVEEKAWNCFPYCKTELTNPMLGDRFAFRIETRHYDNDRGEQENVHGLNKDERKAASVEFIDIADKTQIKPEDYKEEEDPALFKSEKTGRGPLVAGEWQKTADPVMCCYKLVSIEFRWWGLQTKVQNYVMGLETSIFANFHRKLFCWIDEWNGMTIEDIRELERKTQEALKAQIADAPTATK